MQRLPVLGQGPTPTPPPAATPLRSTELGAFRYGSKLERRIVSKVGQAVCDYNLLADGDRVMVCVSGGKDSYALLDVLLLLEREKTVAEGAGAVGLAALVQHKTKLRDKKVAVLVGGGNIDVNLLSRIIERGLVKDGRLVRLRVRIPDHPGALHKLTGLIANVRANILDVHHNRAFSRVDLGETSVDVTLETRGPDHIADLMRLLDENRYQHERLF